MIDQVRQQLEKFGLTEIESKIYILLLTFGDQPVSVLARKGKLKRTNLYNILEKLQTAGIVNEYAKGKVRYFRACEPEKLIKLQENKKRKIDDNILQLQRVLPLLQNMKNPLSAAPQVRYYKGAEEIQRLLSETLVSNEFLAYFNPTTAYEVIADSIEYFIVEQAKKKMHIRELVVQSKKTKYYLDSIKNPNHKCKVLPKKYNFFSDNIIFGNSIAFMSYLEEPIGVVIESEDIARTYRTVFEIMWNSI